MTTRKQEEYQDKVIKSRLYKSGNSFTLSDIIGILDISSAYTRQVLSDLVDDGFLSQVDSDTCMSYSSVSPIRRMLRDRLSSYEPPMTTHERQMSPWIRASVRQEHSHAVGQ